MRCLTPAVLASMACSRVCPPFSKPVSNSPFLAEMTWGRAKIVDGALALKAFLGVEIHHWCKPLVLQNPPVCIKPLSQCALILNDMQLLNKSEQAQLSLWYCVLNRSLFMKWQHRNSWRFSLNGSDRLNLNWNVAGTTLVVSVGEVFSLMNALGPFRPDSPVRPGQLATRPRSCWVRSFCGLGHPEW